MVHIHPSNSIVISSVIGSDQPRTWIGFEGAYDVAVAAGSAVRIDRGFNGEPGERSQAGDPDKGTLTQIGRFPTEKTPRGFAIDPRGKFLLSVGMDSAGMTVYSIDRASGELKPIGHYPMGTQPNWIEIVDLK